MVVVGASSGGGGSFVTLVGSGILTPSGGVVTGGRIGVGSGVGVTAGAEVGTTGAGVGVVGWGVGVVAAGRVGGVTTGVITGVRITNHQKANPAPAITSRITAMIAKILP
jgi:hypothetical protein